MLVVGRCYIGGGGGGGKHQPPTHSCTENDSVVRLAGERVMATLLMVHVCVKKKKKRALLVRLTEEAGWEVEGAGRWREPGGEGAGRGGGDKNVE